MGRGDGTAGGGCPYMACAGPHVWFGYVCRDRRIRLRGRGGRFCFRRWVGVVGDFFDHLVFFEGEVDVAGVADGDVEGAEDQFGALELHGAADQGVDDLHDGGLDGFRAFEQGDVVQARVGDGDGADHALMEIAETLSAESGGLAAESVDLDMSAGFGVGHKLVGPLDYFLVVSG